MQCVFDISARNAGVFLSGVLFAAERLGLEILSIEIGMQPSRVNTHLDVVVQGANPEALLVEIKRLDGYVDVSFRPIAETMKQELTLQPNDRKCASQCLRQPK